MRSLRQMCRRAEHRWKRDKLQVSFEMLRDSLALYQKSLKVAKARYFSGIINENSHRPKILFKMVNATINPSVYSVVDVSSSRCEDFLMFFISKINDLRVGITQSPPDPLIYHSCSAVFSRFNPITGTQLQEIVENLRPSGSSDDVIPPFFLKQVFEDVHSLLLVMLNRCLETGIIPEPLKHASVYPLFKKTELGPHSDGQL